MDMGSLSNFRASNSAQSEDPLLCIFHNTEKDIRETVSRRSQESAGRHCLGLLLFKCELRHNLFYVDNTRQVRGVLPGHAR